MSDQGDRRSAIVGWATLVGVAFVFPVGAVLLAHWWFDVSLPTLMFISFALLFFGGFLCYPVYGKQESPTTPPSIVPPPDGGVILLIGHASGLGVLILYFVRLFSQGLLFSWM